MKANGVSILKINTDYRAKGVNQRTTILIFHYNLFRHKYCAVVIVSPREIEKDV